jgi:hypothetical protein
MVDWPHTFGQNIMAAEECSRGVCFLMVDRKQREAATKKGPDHPIQIQAIL